MFLTLSVGEYRNQEISLLLYRQQKYSCVVYLCYTLIIKTSKTRNPDLKY